MADPGIEIALNTLRWFFLAIDEDVYSSLESSMLEKTSPRISPIYRGKVYTLNQLHNVTSDLSMLPATVTGLKGLKAIQKGLHGANDAPNTVLYTQLSGFDDSIHSYKSFGLLFFHPKNKVLLDITIQIPEGYEEGNVILDVSIFVPNYHQQNEQIKRYIHFRRESWASLVNNHISLTLESLLKLSTSTKDEKIDYYKSLANKKWITIKAKRIINKDDLI